MPGLRGSGEPASCDPSPYRLDSQEPASLDPEDGSDGSDDSDGSTGRRTIDGADEPPEGADGAPEGGADGAPFGAIQTAAAGQILDQDRDAEATALAMPELEALADRGGVE